MDGFDPFENHENVIGSTEAKPSSLNNDMSGVDFLSPSQMSGGTKNPEQNSGIYPSLIESSSTLNTGVDPYNSFRESTVDDTVGIFSFSHENDKLEDNVVGNGHFTQEPFTENEIKYDTSDSNDKDKNTTTVVSVNTVGESLIPDENKNNNEVVIPRIHVSDAPDVGVISSMSRKVESLFVFVFVFLL